MSCWWIERRDAFQAKVGKARERPRTRRAPRRAPRRGGCRSSFDPSSHPVYPRDISLFTRPLLPGEYFRTAYVPPMFSPLERDCLAFSLLSKRNQSDYAVYTKLHANIGEERGKNRLSSLSISAAPCRPFSIIFVIPRLIQAQRILGGNQAR